MHVTPRRLASFILSACLGLPAPLAAQQPVTITGTVRSDAGQPLAQVEVAIPSMALGAISKDDGGYTIVVPAVRVTGQTVTLVARRLGYKAAIVQIVLSAGGASQDFRLVANPLQLGEVVITGAGTASATEKLGSVRNSVDSTSIQRSNEQNIVAALAGKAPNVQVTSTAGDPGASAYIRVRGLNTLTGTGQPLIVVDGTPIDNSTEVTGGNANNVGSTIATNRAADINPADVANIEILKGASAAAIYGARAGQGVVLITTKSGQAGPTRTTFRSDLLINEVTQGVPLQTVYGQGSGGNAATCAARGCSVTSGSWGAKLAPGTPVYDHFGDLFRTGYLSDNNLTVAGGDDKTLFYISGEYMYNRGTMVGPNNHYQRTSVRLKASQRLTGNLSVAGNVAYANDIGSYIERGSNVSGLLLGSLRTPPEFNDQQFIDSATGLQRSYRYPLPAFGSNTTSRGYDNPFFVLNKDLATGRVGRVYGNVSVNYSPIAWLNLSEQLGLDYSNDERVEGLAQSSSAFPLGQVTSTDYKHMQVDHNLVATASYTLSPDLGGTFTLGQGLNSRSFRQIEVIGNGLVAPEPFDLLNTVDRSPPNDAETIIHTESYFGQATLDMYSQLYWTVAVRNDGMSTFGTSNRRNWFPKGSLAWEFTKSVLPENDLLSYGKLRFAYGQTGTEPDPYQTSFAYVTTAFADAGWGPFLTPTQAGRGGIYTGAVKAQPNLKPERTEEFEGGLDLGFLKSERADLHFTYYHQNSSDVIFLAPLAPSSGFALQAQNAATIRNKGYELSLNLRPVSTADMRWEVGAQWAKNDNVVTALKGTDFITIPNAGFTDPQGSAFVGYPVGELRGTDFIRCGRGTVDPTFGNIDAQCGTARKGAIYLPGAAFGAGVAGYPQLDQSLWPIADPNPKWTGSVQSALHYRKWAISGLLDVKHGGQMWNGTRGALTFFGTAQNTLVRDVTKTFGKDYYQSFTFGGPGVGMPVTIDQNSWYQGGVGSGFTGPSSQFIENASFVKLREIALAYTLDDAWVRNTLGVDAIDLRVAGRNLKTWTKYTGIDPESTLFGATASQQGFDYFGTPQTRSVTVSVTLHR